MISQFLEKCFILVDCLIWLLAMGNYHLIIYLHNRCSIHIYINRSGLPNTLQVLNPSITSFLAQFSFLWIYRLNNIGLLTQYRFILLIWVLTLALFVLSYWRQNYLLGHLNYTLAVIVFTQIIILFDGLLFVFWSRQYCLQLT